MKPTQATARRSICEFLVSPAFLCVVSFAQYLVLPDFGLFPSWACGVILFTLLAGSPPFWHRRQILMLRMIMEGQYQFSSPEWDDRSNTVKDLVSWGHERARRENQELPLMFWGYPRSRDCCRWTLRSA